MRTSSTFASRADPFQKLGELEIAVIVEHLDPLDIIRLQLVSRIWRNVLNSERVSRIALIHAFPQTSETRAFKNAQQRLSSSSPSKEGDVSAITSFRRCCYRDHTRRLGYPTTISHHIMQAGAPPQEADNNIEWDVAGGYVSWISNNSVIHIQNMHGRPNSHSSVDFMKILDEHNIKLWFDAMDMACPKVNMQVGDNVVCATLNFYDTLEDGYGSGRRALFLIFSTEDLRFLWHTQVHLPNRILGEVDTTRGHFTYIRKSPRKPRVEASEEPDETEQDVSEVYLVVHDLFTGHLISEILLERGNDIAQGDIFFIVVSDTAFKRLIVLYQLGSLGSPHSDFVYARIYAIDPGVSTLGKVMESRILSRDPNFWLSHGRRIGTESDIYMDYPPRPEMFDICESVFTWAKLPGIESPSDVSSASDSSASDTSSRDHEQDLLRLARSLPALNAPLIPPIIPFHTWNIDTSPRANKLEFYQSRYLSELSLEQDFYQEDGQLEILADADGPTGPLDLCRRFEVFLPFADLSVIFTAVDAKKYKCEMGIYEEAPPETAERWSGYIEQFQRGLQGVHGSYDRPALPSQERSLDPGMSDVKGLIPLARTMQQKARREMSARFLKQQNGPVVDKDSVAMPYEILDDGRIRVKGNVGSSFLHSVQWAEGYIAVQNSWFVEVVPEPTVDDEEGIAAVRGGQTRSYNAVLVFDFEAPW